MKFFYKGKDGGPESTVTGYWLVEIKSLFSVVLLRFDEGTREVYHSHSFHALSWFLSGEVDEHHMDGRVVTWKPSLFPKWTPRTCFHKVFAKRRTWCLSFRGPWSSSWYEYLPKTKTTRLLQNGRKIVKETE